MSNRHDRRTRGKWIIERLAILKKSQILKDADLSGIQEDEVKLLVEQEHENKTLQKRYNLCMKTLDEIIRLEAELLQMKQDLEGKQKLLHPSE